MVLGVEQIVSQDLIQFCGPELTNYEKKNDIYILSEIKENKNIIAMSLAHKKYLQFKVTSTILLRYKYIDLPQE